MASQWSAVAVATMLDIALWGTISPNASPLYIAAIMVTGWFGGLGPGLFATALAAGASVYLFIDPVYSFRISPPDMLRLVVFVAVVLLVSWLNARRKDAEAGAGSKSSGAGAESCPAHQRAGEDEPRAARAPATAVAT